MMGMEIRATIADYVRERILALRRQHPDQYQNISVVRTNSMKYLVNHFRKAELKKIFFLFPDPHFKKANHRRRIVSSALLSEYAYVLRVGGIAYTITDVHDLHVWMVQHFTDHPLFERVSDDELASDPVVPLVKSSSEESKKVDRISGEKWLAVFRRVAGKRDSLTSSIV
mmetsp:Transcript_27931/g.46838  ORF Transcript_27931/g.46838 Transcript_27931/m.46838 type:complete len:170 (+) Transcript_27931:62-571(+)